MKPRAAETTPRPGGAIRAVMRAVAAAVCLFAVAASAAVPLRDTFYSPKNKERPVRKSTRFIVLHTTEGSSRGSGAKLQKNGEAHYMVDTGGEVYRVIDRKRVAYHCGRSMWNGLSSLDNYSIGIEVVGYHNKDLTAAQYKAIKELLDELKRIYKVPDDRVLTHSMVAYGTPNQWHRRSHRGRKRCGMRMALPSVRRKLGLMSKPAYDPDVRAGRLVVADKELQQLLYSVDKKSSSAKGSTAKAGTSGGKGGTASGKGAAPSGKTASTGGGKTVASAGGKPAASSGKGATPSGGKAGTSSSGKGAAPSGGGSSSGKGASASAGKVAGGSAAGGKGGDGDVIGPRRSAWDIAREAYAASTTVYEFPDGSRKTGAEISNWKAMPAGTRVRLGVAAASEPTSKPDSTPAPEAPAEPVAEPAATEPAATGSQAVAAASDGEAGAAPVAAPNAESVATGDTAADGEEVASGATPAPEGSAPDASAPVDEEAAIAQYAAKEAASGGNVIGPGHSAWDIARDAYNAVTTVYEFPDGSRKTGAEITNWKAIPAGTRVTLPEGDVNEPEPVASLASTGLTAAGIAQSTAAAIAAIAGAEWNSERTIYVAPDGSYVKGDALDAEKLAALSPETKVFSGYRIGGPVTGSNPAFSICGPSWRDEGTHFLFPDGRIVTGDKVDPRRIPPKTMVLYKD